MNPDDYDNDGNNIVPCPICLSNYCPSKEDGKCPDEDMFALEGEIRMLLDEYKATDDNSRIANVLEAVEKLIHQELQKALTEKDTWWQKHEQDMYESLEEAHKELLQKARHNWLREEIVRLEDEQKDIERRMVKNGVYMERVREMDTYRTFQTIIDRYQSELDQPIS